jgi:hypothetical protein
MAKISARGETEHVRFEGPGGEVVVLTKRLDLRPGRLLHKAGRDYGYTVVTKHRPDRRGKTLMEAAIDAEKFAAARGLAKSPVRA